MVIERARLAIKSGEEQLFEAAFAQALPLFLRARGCTAAHIERVVEDPSIYVLVVAWDDIEDHTVHFRGSDDFQEWRRLAGPHFASPPTVEHLSIVAIGG